MPGTLFVVATPIGNLEDITARALRVLREAALIAAEDTRRTAHLLARYAITTPTTSLHEHNEASKTAALVERLKRGESIALVSDAGTPTVSDPGTRLIRAAIEAGLRVEPIPGPSAVLAALAASGFSSDSFIFLGFPPTRSKERSIWFNDLKHAGRTAVFFEAPHRLTATLEELQRVIGDCRVVLGRELTKIHEILVRGQISTVLKALQKPIGEFTVVVEIGRMTELDCVAAPGDHDMAIEFGELTEHESLPRNEAVSTLAKRHGLTRNAVYSAIERAKKSAV